MQLRSFIHVCITVSVGFGAFAVRPSAFAQSDLFASINRQQTGGGAIYEYPNEGAGSAVLSGLSQPRGIAFDSSGNLYVATNSIDVNGDTTATVTEYDGQGNPTVIGTGAQDVFVTALALDSSGNVYALGGNIGNINNPNSQAAATIYKFTPNGPSTTFGNTTGENQGFGLAFDSLGNLYASDTDAQIIYRFAPDGTRTVFANSSQFAAGHGPVGLAFDSMGNLFVSTENLGTGTGSESILKFNALGVASTFASGLTNNPRGIAFDGAGNLFVAEVPAGTTGDILKFTPGGNESVFASGLGRTIGNGGPEYIAFAPLEAQAVPEPSTWVAGILVSGALTMSSWRRKLWRRA